MEDKILEARWMLLKSKGIRSGACLLWPGSTSRGYGQAGFGGVTWRLHRLAFYMEHGSIPLGKDVDHICNNPTCYEVKHLQLLTHRENCLRSNCVSGLNYNKTHCCRGHEFTEENTYVRKLGHRNCRQCRRKIDAVRKTLSLNPTESQEQCLKLL